MGTPSLLLLGVLCGLYAGIAESTISSAQASNNLMRVAASLPSTVDASSVAWQNSTWNLAGRGVPAGSSGSKFLQPEGGVLVVDQQFIVTFKPSATSVTAKEVDGLFVTAGASVIQASDSIGPNAWSGVLFTAPKYAADWAYLLQRLADMPDVMAVEPNFVVSTVFSTEAVAAQRQQQRQQPTAPVPAADLAAATTEGDSTAATDIAAETGMQSVAQVQPTAEASHVLEPTFAATPLPAAVALETGQVSSAASTMQASKHMVGGTLQIAAAAAADWLPQQQGGGRKMKAR